MLKNQEPLLRHILDEIEFILKHSRDLNIDSLIKDEILQRAIVRSLEIIGEAVKQIGEKFKKQHSDIEWKRIAGFRDVLIHRYFSVDWDIVWDVIMNEIPVLKSKLILLL